MDIYMAEGLNFVSHIIRHICQSGYVKWQAEQTKLYKQFLLGPNKWHASSLIKNTTNVDAYASSGLFSLSLSLTADSHLSPRPKEAAIKSLWNNWWSAQSVLTVMWPDEGDDSSPALYVWERRSVYFCMKVFWLSSQSVNQLIRLGNWQMKMSGH